MGHVFISYSAKDHETVDYLNRRLTSSGFAIWTDTQRLFGGRVWRRQLVDAIATADVVLLVLSANAMRSVNVRKELDIADEARRNILPVEIEPVTVSHDFAYQLAGLQRVRLNPADGERQLIVALELLTSRTLPDTIDEYDSGRQSRTTKEPQARSLVTRTRRKSSLSIMGIAVVALIVSVTAMIIHSWTGLLGDRSLEIGKADTSPTAHSESASREGGRGRPAAGEAPSSSPTAGTTLEKLPVPSNSQKKKTTMSSNISAGDEKSTSGVLEPSPRLGESEATKGNKFAGTWDAAIEYDDTAISATLVFVESASGEVTTGKFTLTGSNTLPQTNAGRSTHVIRVESDVRVSPLDDGHLQLHNSHAFGDSIHNGGPYPFFDEIFQVTWLDEQSFIFVDNTADPDLTFKRRH